jgi:hypothetical protein
MECIRAVTALRNERINFNVQMSHSYTLALNILCFKDKSFQVSQEDYFMTVFLALCVLLLQCKRKFIIICNVSSKDLCT